MHILETKTIPEEATLHSKMGSIVKDRPELVNEHIEVYGLIRDLFLIQHREQDEQVKELLGHIINLITAYDAFTEKDIIMRYSKDYLIACWETWDAERREKEEVKIVNE